MTEKMHLHHNKSNFSYFIYFVFKFQNYYFLQLIMGLKVSFGMFKLYLNLLNKRKKTYSDRLIFCHV